MVLSMDRWVGKVAVVTGASSGIGAAIADQLVANGLIVVGLARRPELVEKRAKELFGKKGKLHAVRADVSKEEDILKAFKWISDNLGPVHILINNAGIGKFGSIIEQDTETLKMVLDVNVLGLCIATREAVKIMRANKINGHIIHINSVLGHQVTTTVLSILPASKFAVTALTETLRQELNSLGTKIKITSVSPGLVATPASTLNENLPPARKAMFEKFTALKSEDVADSVVYALSTPEHVQIHELMIRPIGPDLEF